MKRTEPEHVSDLLQGMLRDKPLLKLAQAHEELSALFAGHGCRLLDLGREPERRHAAGAGNEVHAAEELSLEDYFLQFYRRQTGKDDPSPEELSLIRYAAEQVGAGLEKSDDELADALVRYAMKQEVKAE